MLFLVNSLIQALVQLSSEVIVFHSAPADGQKPFLIPGLIGLIIELRLVLFLVLFLYEQ